VKQYEIWWADLPKPAGRPQVLLLRLGDAYPVLNSSSVETILPIVTTVSPFWPDTFGSAWIDQQVGTVVSWPGVQASTSTSSRSRSCAFRRRRFTGLIL